jgi:WD40 repeat protein
VKEPSPRLRNYCNQQVGYLQYPYREEKSEETMFLAAGENESVKLYASGSYELIKSFDGHGSPVNCLCISEDDRLLAVGTLATGVWIYDLPGDMSSVPRYLDVSMAVLAMCFSANNERLLTQVSRGGICNWDLPTMTQLFSVQTHSVFNYAESRFCVGDRQFVSISQHELTSLLTLWNAETGVIEKRFDEIDFVSGIDISPGRSAVAIVRGYKSILIFDLLLERISHDIAVTSAADYSVCRYIDATQLMTGGRNATALWDLTTQTMLTSYSLNATSLSVLGGTRYVACGIAFVGEVVVVSVDSGEVVWKLANAHGVAFSCATMILM